MINNNEMLGLSERHVEHFDEDNHALYGPTLHAFLKMQASAKNDKVDIQVCSSFRSFERQLSIWNRKWRGDLPLYTLDGDILNPNDLNDADKIHAIMLWSALPGASRHHWGTDFDVYDRTTVEKRNHHFKLIPEEYERNGPCANLSKWIKHNAASFGFSLPYARYCGGVAEEPWHMSHTNIAQQIEQALNPDVLYSTLEHSDILGKSSILKILPKLLNRYTYNRGIQGD